MRRRRSRGFTLVETAVSLGLVVTVLYAAMSLLDSSGRVARSATDRTIASDRVGRTLAPVGDLLRNGSRATIARLDGVAFGDGEADVGFQLRRVVAWEGAPRVGPVATVRWTGTPGGPAGDVIRSEGPVQTILARGVTDFRVSRSGGLFTVEIDTRAGPADDGARVVTGRVRVAARNP